MKVLYLTQWYPHRYDAMMGLFVRNHAKAAVREGVDVCVLYCHPVAKELLPDADEEGIEVVDQTTEGVREVYIYHSCNALKALTKGREEVVVRWGAPDLFQVNVLNKSALFAYEGLIRWDIPYVLVEHWSGYLPNNGDYMRNNGFFRRKIYERIARKAVCILPVSKVLQDAMQACGIHNQRWEIIRNVVEPCFFEGLRGVQKGSEGLREVQKGSEGLREVQRGSEGLRGVQRGEEGLRRVELLHVSCFDDKAKNVKGILRAVQRLSQKRQDFHLTVIGTGQDFSQVKAFADSIGITDHLVTFVGEKTPQEVHEAMLQSDICIQFSRYETAGVVLSECLASGLPIISTPVGIAPEIVNSDTGLLVPSENEGALAKAIDSMMNRLDEYKPDVIRSYAEPFSEASVGKQLKDLYKSVLS